jgi:site-specific DNA-methyltransferase (cytosine-N4-specific)
MGKRRATPTIEVEVSSEFVGVGDKLVCDDTNLLADGEVPEFVFELCTEDPASYKDRVFIGDSRDMYELPEGSVDLIVTSPPYFNIKDYALDGKQQVAHKGTNKIKGQIGDLANFDAFVGQLLEVWRECERVLAPNGKLVINTPLMPMIKRDFSTHENRHIFDLNAEIQKSILTNLSDVYLLDTYIWNRSNPTKKLMFGSYPHPPNFYAQNTIEFVTVYVKAGPTRRRSPEQKLASKLTQSEWVNLTTQVWDIPIPNKSDPAFGTHSALMPQEIAERCIKLFSLAGDTVLDPFTGSGTTLRAAQGLGRHFVGYELVPAYEKIINVKLDADVISPRQPRPIITDARTMVLDEIAHSDCFDYLDTIPRKSVHLACIDPPYNLGKGGWDTWASEEEFFNFTERWLDATIPTLAPGAGLFVFNTPRNAAHILEFLVKRGLTFQNWITWDKRDGFSSTSKRFVPEQETIIYFTNGASRVFNSDAVRIPYESAGRITAAASTGIIKNGKRWFPNALGRRCPDVWHITSERHKTKVAGRVQSSAHPTPKPLDLIQRIVLAASNPGDVILDCFMGTGTTAVAAELLGRHFIGCESNQEYLTKANERLAELREAKSKLTVLATPTSTPELSATSVLVSVG